MNPKVELRLSRLSTRYLIKGRPDWDVPHTHAVVIWIKKLMDKNTYDENILIPAAYLHDIGYSDQFTKGYSFADNQVKKPDHMIRGELIAGKILREIGGFSEDEITKIIQLVRTHDDLDSITATPEGQLLFEADSLTSIDVERVKPNFDKENYGEFLASFERTRAPLFKTEKGKKALLELMKKARDYFA
ncbi:MAG: HD domain-containing protein [Candidatus Woesearchaeota archaeon]